MKFFVQASLAAALAVCSIAAPASALPTVAVMHGPISQVLEYYNYLGEVVFSEIHYCDGHVKTVGRWDGTAVVHDWIDYNECG